MRLRLFHILLSFVGLWCSLHVGAADTVMYVVPDSPETLPDAIRAAREYRHVYDCAGIYTMGNQPGTVISENVVRDIAHLSYVPVPDLWFCLDTDGGSSNITVRDNWTLAGKYLKNAVGPGNLWENNGPQVNNTIKAKAGR